ncbi:hypothetical protein [Blautia sp.]|uniref:hypothetical protein n=1 Tax=Blautia sp. TaxID=1955243 RepID=UPI00399FE3A7
MRSRELYGSCIWLSVLDCQARYDKEMEKLLKKYETIRPVMEKTEKNKIKAVLAKSGLASSESEKCE